MKHPALLRILGAFLVLACLLTLVSGGVAWFRAGTELEETLSRNRLLRSRYREAETLSEELELRQDAYDTVSAVYPAHEEAHRSDSTAYRMKLATFTATRAGVVLGRRQLDEAGASLEESMELFQTGLFMFLRIEEAFQSVYDAYEMLRGTLDQGASMYDEAAAMLADQIEADREYEEALAAALAEAEESGEEPVLPEARLVLDPDEVLVLTALGHQGYGELSSMLSGLQDQMPDDQHQAGDFVRQAMEEYGEYGPAMEGFSVEALAYGVSQSLYDEAQAAMQARIDEGMSEEEAQAAADELCQAAFGLSFEEVGQWLDENEPESTDTGEGAALSPELLDMVIGEMPSDKDLIDIALSIVAASERDLSEKEGAFIADPHDVGTAELLLAAVRESLDSSERIVGLVEPTILSTKDELTRTHEQLDAAWFAIYSAQLAVEEGYEKLKETERDLVDQRDDLETELAVLEKETEALQGQKAVIDEYESVLDRFRSARAWLLADERIDERVHRGGELFSVSLDEITQRSADSYRALDTRRLSSMLMIDAAVFGLLAALCAFGQLSDRRLWLWLLLAALCALAGEWLSLREGRGLWISAAALYGIVVVMIPLSFFRTRGKKT